MTAFHAFILGLVQGIAEFLPVSSSGHLSILEQAFGIVGEGSSMMLFNILLHCATLFIVLLYYRKRVWYMLYHPFTSELKWLVLATLPTVAVALLIDTDNIVSDGFIVWAFLITSIILLISGMIGEKRRDERTYHKKARWYDALFMGIMQVFSILPGVSRFGSTTSGGLITGLTRRRAVDFAFLMSIPAVCGSIVLEAKDLILGEAPAQTVPAICIIIGMLTAIVFGILSMRFIQWFVRRHTLLCFSFYTFLVSAFLILNRYALRLF